jgi:hypothetical protein
MYDDATVDELEDEATLDVLDGLDVDVGLDVVVGCVVVAGGFAVVVGFVVVSFVVVSFVVVVFVVLVFFVVVFFVVVFFVVVGFVVVAFFVVVVLVLEDDFWVEVVVDVVEVARVDDDRTTPPLACLRKVRRSALLCALVCFLSLPRSS